MPDNKPASFQAPQSARKEHAIIAASEADAKALGNDTIWVREAAVLNEHLPYLENYDEVVVAIPDPERAHATARYIRALHKHLPIAIPIPSVWNGAHSMQEFMDSQHLIPPQAASALSVGAEYVPDGGCYKPDDKECLDFELAESIMTGIPGLDREMGGLRYGELSILVGGSGQGKSTFADQLVLSAVSQDIPSCVFSGELSKAMHNTWLFGQAGGKAAEWVEQKGTGKLFPVVKDVELKGRIKEALQRFTSFVDCDNDIISFPNLMRCFKTHAKRGYRFFVVDNLMALTIGAGDKEYAFQADIIYTLLRFAAKYNVHVMVLAHPKKTDGEIKNLNDISGSSKMANWAHEVLAIHKYSPEEKAAYEAKHEGYACADARIKILKSRVAPSDAAIFLNYDQAGRRFFEPGNYPQFVWECPQNTPHTTDDAQLDFMANMDELKLPF